uniref:HSF-type DNA-binding domain-containing protein n=1 Tax=Trichogramma kaykai TaxID=54128 RepID=A0ABD2X5Y4_9HYME
MKKCVLNCSCKAICVFNNFQSADGLLAHQAAPSTEFLIDKLAELNNFDAYRENLKAEDRKDFVYLFFRKPLHLIQAKHSKFGIHKYRNQFQNKLRNHIRRPFSQYGPPNPMSSMKEYFNLMKPILNNQYTKDSIIAQGIPSPIKFTDFIEVSPISSQNDQPFGQNTANYLPPRNQKLPIYSPEHFYKNHIAHNVNQLSTQLQQQQKQQIIQNENLNHHISDAAHFLTQNAQAISNLYGAPALNQNYAPNVEQLKLLNQNPRQIEHLQINHVNGQPENFENNYPVYLQEHQTLPNLYNEQQFLTHAEMVAQLQTLINQDNSYQYSENNNQNQKSNPHISFHQISPEQNPIMVTTSNHEIGKSEGVASEVSSSSQEGLNPSIVNPSLSPSSGFIPTPGSAFQEITSVDDSKNSPSYISLPFPFAQEQQLTHVSTSPIHHPEEITHPHHFSLPLGIVPLTTNSNSANAYLVNQAHHPGAFNAALNSNTNNLFFAYYEPNEVRPVGQTAQTLTWNYKSPLAQKRSSRPKR